MNRTPFWIVLGLLSLAAAAVGIRYFPAAFSIVALDITMDRERALAEARKIAVREQLGPPGYHQAASFTLDGDTQTFVELEGGGKDAFTMMLREGLYSAYTWRVRHFREGEPNETLIRFTPDGRPYGFVERLKEDAPGAALDASDARRRAESAAAKWNVDLSPFALAEQGQERRPSGRVDHTFTYERSSPSLNEGRYRLRLVVSGDRLTEITHFVRIPEAFSRRYDSMRSANNAIGVGSAVGMALLYVIGGIGIGLFYMLRSRWVVWRPALVWGLIVALLQMLAAINEWPLMWMTYDTALPRATFLAQQVATLLAAFIGFSAFFALSFMAAETMTRRAFGRHPQLWHVWSTEPGSSSAIWGRTAAGYLLVAIFFAYEIGLYVFATRTFGWWTPSETLIHPDVLATYVPWLSAIANSLQAGFWEECLFRAVPIAGAALIGEYFGQRRVFIILAFVVQAAIFGAGHAPYPTQPSYARPVELILPSIGFGLLYVYFGLLPAIVLHFAFDVVWFALPIFLSDAPGIHVQQAMVVLLTLVPVWVVLWRRMQAGTWTVLAPHYRNAAWTPPPPAAPVGVETARASHSLGPRTKIAWFAVAAVSLVVCLWALAERRNVDRIAIGREDAARIARATLQQRSVSLGSQWRVMPTPDNGGGAPHDFVSTTGGETRRRELLGTYLPTPGWNVRVATFQGDVAERAEEWRIALDGTGGVRGITHTLAEAAPGSALDEASARRLAHQALLRDFQVDAAQGQVREVSAGPQKLQKRTDWVFTFADTTVTPLPQGEPRMTVRLSGDEVAQTRRFVYVPEDWARRARAAQTRNLIVRILTSLVFGGILATSAIMGVVAWSRRRFSPRLFLAAFGLMFVLSVANAANGWPAALAALPTSQPLQLQILALVGIGVVGLTVVSALVALAIGALPQRLAPGGGMPYTEALKVGIAIGVFGTAVSIAAAALRTPEWARTPDVDGLGTVVPLLAVILDPLPGYLTRVATLLSALVAIDYISSGFTRRRAVAALSIVLLGFLGSGLPPGVELAPALAAGILTGAALLVAYALALRADLTMLLPAVGVMIGVRAIAEGIGRPFPSALPGSVVAAVLVGLLAWAWFGAFRKARRTASWQPAQRSSSES